ncbi:MAG: HyaD/HybD family hydrogenase maturation endopeptidase [Deltaproteobacteria bacterium]|nr:HyaD/HybD family hydrogenase maturation endopeptidase [Deltaproteobacteria bacterium]
MRSSSYTAESTMNALHRKITILGVGNVLLKDEGVGVFMAQRFERKYVFPDYVEIVDGGTLGLSLLSVVTQTERLLVFDAVKNRGTPGDTYLLEYEDLPFHIRAKNSLHQTDLMETLTLAGLVGERPETVVVGVEPLDIEPWGIGLTPPVRESIERLERLALDQLGRWGIFPETKTEENRGEGRICFPFGDEEAC